MERFLLSIFFSFLFLSLQAQDKQVKKIQLQLKMHTQADTFRVNRLNDLLAVLPMPPDKIDSLASEALAISEKLNYPEGKVYALLSKSTAMAQKSRTREAFGLRQQAINLAETIRDKTYLVRALSSMGGLKMNTGENTAALANFTRAEALAQTTQNKSLIANVQSSLSGIYQNSLGDYAKGMDWGLKAERNAEEAHDSTRPASAWSNLAGIYLAMGNNSKSLVYYKKALAVNKKLGNKFLEFTLLNRIGERYRLSGHYPEAIKSYQEGLSITKSPYNIELTQSNMADVYVRMGNLPMAFKYGFLSLNLAKSIKDTEGEEWIEGILARAYLKINQPDSALYHAHSGYDKSIKTATLEFKRDNSEALANAYNVKHDYPDAFKYYKLFISYRDSMSNAQMTNQANVLEYNYDLAKKQTQITLLNRDKKAQRYFLTGAFIVIGLIVITVVLLLRNSRQKQKAYVLLSKQKEMIEDQRDQTNKALADLQYMQNQLIQSEKMASLGELTAGIAHEIQNPLNFVNNFSEVTAELMDEMEEEFNNDNKQNGSAIAADIKQNLEKIRHHGKRADSIVKGMLQHSRAGSDTMELTDVNALADEYLRLAYHGLRAKDKAFNAELVTDYGSSIPIINMVPQDIGRVLLNLFTNAFYATQQKQKIAGPDYKPTVELTTALKGKMAVITVRDNGTGIPLDIKEKIMQPFFTTKPTGQGTGLGLSLSYDIIVKAHSGKIEVDTVEGEFTAVRVYLPLLEVV